MAEQFVTHVVVRVIPRLQEPRLEYAIVAFLYLERRLVPFPEQAPTVSEFNGVPSRVEWYGDQGSRQECGGAPKVPGPQAVALSRPPVALVS